MNEPQNPETPAGSLPRQRFRFRKSMRILRKKEFALVFEQSRPFHGRFLSVRLYDRSGSASRLGLVVGKRAGNAPSRNRIKRRIRELFRTHPDAVPPGSDLVVHVREPATATRAFALLTEEYLTLLKRATRGRGSGRGGR